MEVKDLFLLRSGNYRLWRSRSSSKAVFTCLHLEKPHSALSCGLHGASSIAYTRVFRVFLLI